MTSFAPDLFQPTADLSEEAWRAAVEKALKGASPDRLSSRTEDGIAIDPLYRRIADGTAQAARPAGARWKVMQRIDHPDAADANGLALADLAGGADALELVAAGSPNAYGYGLTALGADDLAAVFKDVYLHGIRLKLSPGPHGARLAPAMAEAAAKLGVAPGELDVDFGLDPVGALAVSGGLPEPWDALQTHTANTISRLREAGFAGPFLTADGRPYHNAGATEALELAAVIATGVAYLKMLEASGVDLADAAGEIGFTVAVDADQFLGIAKLRALRALWRSVTTACGLDAVPMRVHAETSWRMMTERDPWVNMLRSTVATFAAGVGGADSVTVLPFTATLGLADGFARRVARNTQNVLLDESNLYKVTDPGAGSGYVETLTAELATKAWALFQEIEAAGGIVAALTAGLPQKQVREANSLRQKAIESRKRPITGTSEFPNVSEKKVRVLAVPARPLPVSGEDSALKIEALKPMRLAEPFEALRDRGDAIEAKTGSRPKVFLANLGKIADFTTRSSWVKNVFEAGGFETTVNDGFDDPADIETAFKESGAAIACIASSDELYAELGPAAADALKFAGATRVCLAGKAKGMEDALTNAGIDSFVYAGSDIVQELEDAYRAFDAKGTAQ
ncbi:methylmalonyl-CoA mutase subunit beta [Rhodobium gokarnense]|uniref:Methylmalonyl-CoA mutase n=1 Tax=Rhodobium gokarnense TaxID=364296 RepID=A0ABT3HC14_9HYPH|nr:methylmalonyl-CoA mutase subunit beta [Rhodobium gokarnense]MCW2307944.1 methylmalonyl-CoA mutase [Rhodobium gokarnense]